jgi:type I pantothenate kinase
VTGVTVCTRAQWSTLGRPSGGALDDLDLDELAATGEPLAADEVRDVYVPLAELLARLATVRRDADRTVATFLGERRRPAPFLIGIAGGVAVGKSTTARVLQALLRRRDPASVVELLTTDGFLLPNVELERRGLMDRKGFPESYDRRALVETLAALRSGSPEVAAPVYSHLHYDVVPDERQLLRHPDVVIVEGLNVLQTPGGAAPGDRSVADFFDVSCYVDAREEDVARWFADRLVALCDAARRRPEAYLNRFAALDEADLRALAGQVWERINLVNLRENVAPTRPLAQVVLEKGGDHRVERVLVRRG